jgi:hypothetical protein
MHAISAAVLLETKRREKMLGPALLRQLTFLGDDNLSNASAVENLMRMGKKNLYLSFGSKSGLETVLPGVKTSVLGPPTLEQKNMETRGAKQRCHARPWWTRWRVRASCSIRRM